MTKVCSLSLLDMLLDTTHHPEDTLLKDILIPLKVIHQPDILLRVDTHRPVTLLKDGTLHQVDTHQLATLPRVGIPLLVILVHQLRTIQVGWLFENYDDCILLVLYLSIHYVVNIFLNFIDVI